MMIGVFMKKIAIVLFAITPTLFAQSQQPHGLMCEMLAMPEKTKIMDATPEFGWIYDAAEPNDRQTAFQILVADSRDDIEKSIGGIWDSKKVPSSQSIDVEYSGSLLRAHTTYYWRVRTWNYRDEPSAFSTPQKFITGDIKNDYSTSAYGLVKQHIMPTRFVEKAPDTYFFDFGKAAFGTIEIYFSRPCEKQEFVVHLGEKLADSTSIDRTPGGTIRYRKITVTTEPGAQTLIVKIPPDERNTGPRAIKMPPDIGEVLPFRYCEIENSPTPLNANSVNMIAVFYPFDENASFFECSDPVLNDVWELCKYSIKATSFCGIYVDGDRERIPYEADAYINQLCHYSVDREYSMARASHEYLIKNATWPTEWILHSVLMAWADYLYTGDAGSLEHYYDDLKAKTLLALAREDGLISTRTGLVTDELLKSIHLQDRLRDIVDWPPGSFTDGGTGERDNYQMGEINTVVNAFHAHALSLMNQIATALGKQNDAQFFKDRAEQVGASINEKLLNKNRGIYVDSEDSTHSALHANMFPLAFDLVPEAHVASVVEFIKSRGMACSVYGAQYLLEALYKAGEAQYALDLMTARHDRSWPHMIYDVGTTITLEAWDIKYKNNLDWNHAWGAAPANIIPRYLIGVHPIEPGFRSFQIKPQIADLTFAKAHVPTIRGAVYVSVEQNERVYSLTVTIPGNSRATVFVPRFGDSRVIVDGVEKAGTTDGQFIAFENIGAGAHSFVVKK